MLVAKGVTPRPIGWVLIIFVMVYIILTIGLLKLLFTPSATKSGIPAKEENYTMSLLENLCALLVLIGMIMYAAFAGADFGGGLWTALAAGPRAHEQREGLFHAIGPVWETNHIWLIFVVVVLFACFPRGFEYLCIAIIVPLVFALVGINFRGAAFIFRHFGKV